MFFIPKKSYANELRPINFFRSRTDKPLLEREVDIPGRKTYATLMPLHLCHSRPRLVCARL